MDPERRVGGGYAEIVKKHLQAIPVDSREGVRAAIVALRALGSEPPATWSSMARQGAAWVASAIPAVWPRQPAPASPATQALKDKISRMVNGVEDLLRHPDSYVQADAAGRFKEFVRGQVAEKVAALEALEAKNEIEDQALLQLFDAVVVQGKPNFGQLPRLERAAACREWLQENAAKLDAVKALNLSGKGMIVVPKEISLFRNLRELDLSHNAIKNIRVVRLPRLLQVVNFSNNEIQSLQDVDFPDGLKELDVSGNQLRDLRNVAFPGQLRIVDLSFNQIETLEGADFPALQELSLSFNRLHGVRGVKFPEQMQRLDLMHNQLQDLQGANLVLPGLRELNLLGNEISELPSWFVQVPRECRVNLGRNGFPPDYLANWIRNVPTGGWLRKAPAGPPAIVGDPPLPSVAPVPSTGVQDLVDEFEIIELLPNEPAHGAGSPAGLSEAQVQKALSFLPHGEIVLDIGEKSYFVRLEPSKRQNILSVHLSDTRGGRTLGSFEMDMAQRALVVNSATMSPSWPPSLTCPSVINAFFAKLSLTTQVYDKLVQGGAGPAVAGRVVGHWANAWESYVLGRVADNRTQTNRFISWIGWGNEVWLHPPKGSSNRIKGLKIMGNGMACLALKSLGEGSYKKAKEVLFLRPDGTVGVGVVRYAKRNSRNPVDEAALREGFFQDIERQHKIEEKIKRAACVAGGAVQSDEKYVSFTRSVLSHATQTRSGYQVRERFFSDLAQGSLGTYMPTLGPDGGLRMNKGRTPFSEAAWRLLQPAALRVCRDALRGLRYLHACGFVHKDVKPDNVLTPHGMGPVGSDGVQGRLSDLGITVKIGGASQVAGTPIYFAPELFWGLASEEHPATDMFSYGVMLLGVCDPVLWFRLLRVNFEGVFYGQAARTADEVKLVRKGHREDIEAIQKELLRKGGEPWELIAELISFDPAKRPSSEIAEQRLGAIVDNPASPYWRAITS